MTVIPSKTERLSQEEVAFVSQLLEAQPSLRRYARKLAAGSHDTDDLVQEVTARAWAARKDLNSQVRFMAWLRVVMKNHFLDQVRRTRPLASLDDVPEEALVAATSGVISHAESLTMVDILQQLPEPQQAVVKLVLIDGLSHAEAAVREGVSVPALVSRLSRARHKLRRLAHDRGRRESYA